MAAEMDKQYSIGELADAAGVTPRTIRFYTSERLLPPPDSTGRYARYTDEHLERLKAIQHLKKAFLPLHAIREVLESEQYEEYAAPVDSAMDGGEPRFSLDHAEFTEPAGRLRESAAEYIQRITQPIPPPASAPPQGASRNAGGIAGFFNRPRAASLSDRNPPVTGGEHWERIVLSPEVEIHARSPRSTEAQRLLDRLTEAFRRHPKKED